MGARGIKGPEIPAAGLTIVQAPISRLRFASYNPRRISPADLSALERSLRRWGFVDPVIVNRRQGPGWNGGGGAEVIVGGHQRVKAAKNIGLREVPVVYVALGPDEEKLLNLALNRISGEFDLEMLGELLREMRARQVALEDSGFGDQEIMDTIALLEAEVRDSTSPDASPARLADRFGVAPFTVLDARAGLWQERKRAWISIGIKSEIGRGENLLKFSETVLDPKKKGTARLRANPGLWKGGVQGKDPMFYAQKRETEKRLGRRLDTTEFRERYWKPSGSYRGTSVFDPVLCELAVRWFSPPGGRVLDPFAGGSVRGVVAGLLGRAYCGGDLSEAQVKANREQWASISSRAPLPQAPPARPFAPATGPAAPFVTDPQAVTPIEAREGLWLKRDDLFLCNGARGAKVRAALDLLRTAKGVTVAGSRQSTMISRTARVAEFLGLPCRAHVAGSKALSPEEEDAQAHGADLVKHKVNYLAALCAKAEKDAQERGWVYVPLGLASWNLINTERKQVQEIPKGVKRIVVPVGTGMALAGILHGLDDAGLDIPVVGVQVGMRPEKWLDVYAPKGWRERVQIVKASSDFRVAASRTEWWGVELDSHYEAKAAEVARPGDLFWCVAISSVSAVKAAEGKAGPAWARGERVSLLKEIAAVFRAAEKGIVLGAFTGTKETNVAEWIQAGSLRLVQDGGAVVAGAVVQVSKGKEVPFFGGALSLPRGALRVRRLGALPGRAGVLDALLEGIEGEAGEAPVLVESWQEWDEASAVLGLRGFRHLASQVRASSEIVGLWAKGLDAPKVAEAEGRTLARLRLKVPQAAIAALLRGIEREAPAWAQHYSSYNKRKSWTAVALRGYGGKIDSIEKPAEMAKSWKEAHPEALALACEDTPLRARLPEAEALLALIPGDKDRVRLMRLAPGGGELTRHADVTDPDAGVREGGRLRIHIPLVSNEGVRFSMWDLEGNRRGCHMEPGEAWYLDSRKPHTAKNGGESDRLHLVMDAAASPALLRLLGKEAEVEESRRALRVRPEAGEISRPAPAQGPARASAAPVLGRALAPEWKVGDARKIGRLFSGPFDLLFSCPPYGDLEIYSTHPADLSNMAPAAFASAYRECIARACALLREDSFACFVVGDYREKGPKGAYRNFVSETIGAFLAAGLSLYNEAILVTPVGSLPIRSAKAFEHSRKLGKTHQNVLVFVKGDPVKAVERIGPVDFGQGEAIEGEEADAIEE